MSILRQFNWLGQARVDVPHLRSIESSIAADFDVLAGKMIGGQMPLIIKGFNISITSGTIGGPATALSVVVANAIVIHYGASESGSIFAAPSTRSPEVLNPATNTNVSGSFTVSATNYVGFDLVRSADNTTADVVQFLDANSLLETPKSVPLGRTINYKFIISTIPFSAASNVCPIAKVVVDSSGNVTSITDARNMMFRLGSGGDSPNTQYAYPWTAGRKEITTINSSLDMFSGGDKQIGSHADWANAIMTRLWELGGGEYWYTPTADRDVKMIRTGSAMANGDWFTWSGTDLTWQGIKIIFANSTATVNEVTDQAAPSAGLTNLADGDCIYVDVDRTTNRTVAGTNALVAVKVAMTSMGSPTVPGSRFILAWRNGANIYLRDQAYPAGGQFTAATPSALGITKISATSSTPAAPFAATSDSSGNVIGISLTRNNGSGFAAGNITVGTGANDNSITIGRSGQTTTVASFLAITGGSTTAAALTLPSQTAPSSPANGNIWYDGTSLKAQVNSVTETVTMRTFFSAVMLRMDAQNGGDATVAFSGGTTITKFNGFTSGKQLVVGTGLTTDNTGKVTVSASGAGTYSVKLTTTVFLNPGGASSGYEAHLYKGTGAGGASFVGTLIDVDMSASGSLMVGGAGVYLITLAATDYLEIWVKTRAGSNHQMEISQWVIERAF